MGIRETIERLRRLEKKAWPAPFHIEQWGAGKIVCCDGVKPDPDGEYANTVARTDFNRGKKDEATADLIAEARNALPTLLALADLCLEAEHWLDDPDAHAEANATGQIKKWREKLQALPGAEERGT